MKHVQHKVNNQEEGIKSWKHVQHKVNNQRKGIQNWKHVQHKVNNQGEDIQNDDKTVESSKEECKNNTNNVVKIPSTIVVQKGKNSKQTKLE